MTTYAPERDISPQFVSQVSQWIWESGEVLVILRYLASAGAKDFVFCRSPEEFASLVESVATGTDIIVLKENQLPIRGICTASFIENVLGELARHEECLAVSLETREPRHLKPSGYMSDSPEYLKEILEDMLGEEVAVGPCPNFNVDDHETMISASKGGVDGPR